MQKSNEDVMEVVSIVKMAKNLPSISCHLNFSGCTRSQRFEIKTENKHTVTLNQEISEAQLNKI